MSQQDKIVAMLKELLTNRFWPKPDYIRGLLGDGQGNVLVPNRPDYNYVRFNRSSTNTFEVFNKEVSQPVDGWPILLGELPWQPGLFQVVATDWSAYSQTGWGDSVASIQAHAPTHEWPNFQPGSDPLNVYMRAITPLRAQSAGTGSASIVVTAYEYDGATGTNYLWPGVPPLDLSAATPPTGSMRYMGVYLNPQSNTLGVVTGGVTVFTNALEPDRPTWPRNIFPSAYVRLYGGQAMVQERDIRDARRLFDTSLTFTGTPAALPQPIVTGSYLGSFGGTPAWGVVSQLAAPDGNPSPALYVDNTGSVYGVANIITAADYYADGDSYGLWNRLVNWGFTPDEHWSKNVDELAWTGWATYTGFATPALEAAASNSIYRTAHNAAAKAFRYRAAATGDSIYLRARLAITQIVTCGLMVDDGANNADGNGANNFFRVYITQSASGGNVNAVEQYRTGGGAVTTTTTTFTLPPNQFVGLGLRGFGTLWSNWSGQAFIFGESSELIRYTSGASGLTWTPARVGLYAEFFAASGIRKALWDWYDEGVA